MSKELEALNDLGSRLASVDTSSTIEEDHDDVFPIIRKALTPPTKEEVCEAIQEEYGIEKVVCENRRFYDKDDGETLVSQFDYDGKINIDFHDFIFSVDTLIKICRFYEGLK